MYSDFNPKPPLFPFEIPARVMLQITKNQTQNESHKKEMLIPCIGTSIGTALGDLFTCCISAMPSQTQKLHGFGEIQLHSSLFFNITEIYCGDGFHFDV